MGETNPFQLRKFELVASNRDFRKLVFTLDVGLVRLDGMALRLETRAFVRSKPLPREKQARATLQRSGAMLVSGKRFEANKKTIFLV